jgi:heme A synthase
MRQSEAASSGQSAADSRGWTVCYFQDMVKARVQVAGFSVSGSSVWFVLVYAFLGAQGAFGICQLATHGPMSKSVFTHLHALVIVITYAFCILAPGLRDSSQACSCPLQC